MQMVDDDDEKSNANQTFIVQGHPGTLKDQITTISE